MIRLYCYDFIAAGFLNGCCGSCCESCHEDDELGYDMIDLEPDGRSNVDAYICCGMSRVIETLDIPLRSAFVRALRARRNRNKKDNETILSTM